MFNAIMLSSGALWTLTYVLIIRRGFLDRTYGMPLVALCANISWEFIFSFIFHPSRPIQRPVNIVWFCLDLIILLQVLGYGPREFPDLPRGLFYAMFALALALSFLTILSITREFADYDGVYSAYGQNFMMSALFITMLLVRRSLRGQSLAIAIFKMLGTVLASVAFYFYNPDYQGSPLLSFLYVAIFALDLIYILALYRVGTNITKTRRSSRAPRRANYRPHRTRSPY